MAKKLVKIGEVSANPATLQNWVATGDKMDRDQTATKIRLLWFNRLDALRPDVKHSQVPRKTGLSAMVFYRRG